jgi:O-acetyl-ADP-ribose deacetylase (regulator of RNase III)
MYSFLLTRKGYVTSWGGMEVGGGMMYAVSVVDGLVHQVGGLPLKLTIQMLPVLASPDEKCPVGHAVKTVSFGQSDTTYPDGIIHTTPPFYEFYGKGADDPCQKLGECYRNSLELAFEDHCVHRVAVPLLGAGCRGFPLDVAIDVASSACAAWLNEGTALTGEKNTRDLTMSTDAEQTLVFGIPDPNVSDKLIDSLEQSTE